MPARKPEITAADFLPQDHSLPALREASAHCKGCDLWEKGTQTVFGQGVRGARLMLVGEQPGNEEDLEGAPFVGPAGRLLDTMLAEAGIDRATTYVTNVVKHFNWVPKGRMRLHKTPSALEIVSCLPWLEAEIAAVQPRVLVCLGATAAKALIGKDFKITEQRGEVFDSSFGPQILATFHPSAILRIPDPAAKESARQALVSDLRLAASLVERYQS